MSLVSTFPKITVCSYQMHSKKKLERLYPNINDSVLKAFYGMPLNTELSYMKDAWHEFANIDLEKFYIDTMPDIVVEHCLFDSLDCRYDNAALITHIIQSTLAPSQTHLASSQDQTRQLSRL